MDSDGNGMLSYEEVFDLSLASLEKTVKGDNSVEITAELAEFFTRKIFKMVDVDVEDEIPLGKIKDVFW